MYWGLESASPFIMRCQMFQHWTCLTHVCVASECSRLQWLCLCVIYKWQHSTVLLLLVQLLVFLPLLHQCFRGLGEANQNISIDGWGLNNHDRNVKLHDVAQHLPLIYLIVLLQYKRVELLSNIPREATLLSRVQCLKSSLLFLGWVIQINTTCSPPFGEPTLCVCNICRNLATY